MKQKSAVCKRIESCIASYNQRDYESCLINLFPIIDSTAKKRRPSFGVGKRMRAFINDELSIITTIGMSATFVGGVFGSYSIPQVVYKLGRNSLIHDGSLDERLSISEDGSFTLSDDNFILPKAFIMGMMLAVISAKENKNEKLDRGDILIEICGKDININDLWGNREFVLFAIRQRFGDSFHDGELAPYSSFA